uniref:Uncharacterized protein n=2 Tax=Caenorhabditis japonica TaxID=281687 RepID=A0A8R1EH44_CAEJA
MIPMVFLPYGKHVAADFIVNTLIRGCWLADIERVIRRGGLIDRVDLLLLLAVVWISPVLRCVITKIPGGWPSPTPSASD